MPEPEGNKPDPQEPRRSGGPSTKMPSRGIVSWMLFLALALLLVVMLTKGVQTREKITITAFWKHVQNSEIEKLMLKDDSIQGTFKPSDRFGPNASRDFELLYPPMAMDSAFMERLEKELPDTIIDRTPRSYWLEILVTMLPWLFIFLFVWFFVFRQIRSAGGGGGMLGNFSRSKHRVTTKEHVNVTFADVAGIEEAQEEVQELIEFLKNPKKFQRLGGRIPRGVLLVGQPGCGKTLLAKAIAGEADAPFFSISGSDFVEMFVGVGASRVRDLFKQAKDSSPCIIFLDEIDAVGRRRGAGFSGGGHDEREQTLNAILVEMDGFETSDQVIVIAATNRADVLDPALVRPGRFDRQVFVPLPDVQGRYEILKVHARRIKLGPDADMRRVARATPMFSGAELAAVINEAAILATMTDKDYVELEDLEEARDKVRWGRAKKSRKVDEHDQKVTAYHEAGHALVQALTKDAEPVHKVSILPRGPFGGATFTLPERDRTVFSRSFLVAHITVAFGGRIAEEMFFGEGSSGAAMDIKQASHVARQMIKEFGMSEALGLVYYGDGESAGMFEGFGQREHSDATASMIDQEVRNLIEKLFAETKELMAKNRDKIVAIAEALLKHETLSGEEVNTLIRGESLERPSISDLLDEDNANHGPSHDRDDVGKARPVTQDGGQADPELGGGELPAPG